jgi:hypothetical protein
LNPEPEEAAQFAVTLTESPMVVPPRATLFPGVSAQGVQPAYWFVSGIEITSAGRGYPTVSRLKIEVVTGTQVKPAAALAFANNDGEIESVVVETGGEYFLDEGVPQQVVVVRPGVYYREQNDLPPYVASPAVVLTQLPPSNGTEAVIQLTVEQDPTKEEFGRIIAATIPQGQGGSGYHMRSGPRQGPPGTPPRYVFGCSEGDSFIVVTPTRSGLRLEMTSPTDGDTGLPVGLSGTLANERAGDRCQDWFTNALTPRQNLTAGSVTIAQGGAFTDVEQCCPEDE